MHKEEREELKKKQKNKKRKKDEGCVEGTGNRGEIKRR